VRAAAGFRGQPLLVLAGLLGGWLALRVAFWVPSVDAALLAAPDLAEAPAPPERRVAASDPERFVDAPSGGADPPGRIPARHQLRSFWARRSAVPAAWFPPSPAVLVAAIAPAERSAVRPSTVRVAVGHNLLLAAGLSQMELPPALAAYLQHQGPSPPGIPAAAPLLAGLPQHAPQSAGARWSADAWLMVRQDTAAPVASARPSYGRSQAGAVVRYRLFPSSLHAPQAHVRASSALAGPLEKDLAAGLSARPVPRVPLRVALEARVSQTGQGTELRPAAIAVTEFPPVSLPRGVRAEAYVQGGYVGGRFATAFVDGQGRVEHTVARFGEAEVTAGAGAWGGAQKGAARLDIGPTAAVSFRLGEARGRVAADYRVRVAGDAEPRSGPALTLSAGF
jgi:hypothetical protein